MLLKWGTWSNLHFLLRTDGEVIDPSGEEVTHPLNDVSNFKSVESDEYSGASSELTEQEPGDVEVQSPISKRGSLSTKTLSLVQIYCICALKFETVSGATKSRAKKSNLKGQNSSISASTRKNMRSKQR